MPLIGPPKDIFYESPQREEVIMDELSQEHFDKFFAVKPWLCPECGTNNSGHNKACIYCRVRYRKEVSKP